jgi:hypothetical protein
MSRERGRAKAEMTNSFRPTSGNSDPIDFHQARADNRKAGDKFVPGSYPSQRPRSDR